MVDVTGPVALAQPALGPDSGPMPGGQPADPLGSVGLALLAYALVQLLSRVVDRMTLPREGTDAGRAASGFGEEDRKRLERLAEVAQTDHERIGRMEKGLREVHERTRWMDDQRLQARAGGAPFQCLAAPLAEELAVNRRLIGETLDGVRAVRTRTGGIARRLRALRARIAGD